MAQDPAQLSSRQQVQEYMAEHIPAFNEKYEKAQKCDSVNDEYNEWHICSKAEDSNGMAWYQDRFAGKRFLIDDPKFHSDKPNVYELVARLAEERYGTIGFIYPQESGDPDTMIAVIWRPIETSQLEDNFY